MKKTPIIRKVIKVGTSRAVSLPKSWLENFERETGKKITEVAMEVNASLTIQPILPKAKGWSILGNKKKMCWDTINA